MQYIAPMIGRNLHRLRKAKGWSQVDLAERANINRRYYQDLEASRRTPTVAVAMRLRKALRCEWNDLLKGL
jgi:transcriptional regulator with XRE-family HTH domain